MNLSNQSLLVILVVGIVAGWLAGRVMAGGGFGLIGDLLVGLIGAFIGDWLLPRLGIHLGVGIVALIINAFIGAVVLLLIRRLVSGGGSAIGHDGAAGAGNARGLIGRRPTRRRIRHVHGHDHDRRAAGRDDLMRRVGGDDDHVALDHRMRDAVGDR